MTMDHLCTGFQYVYRGIRRCACLTMNCYITIGWLFGGLNFALLDLVALLSLLSEFALSILLGSSTE